MMGRILHKAEFSPVVGWNDMLGGIMNQEKRDKIASLAEEAFRASESYRMAGMQNTQQDPVKRLEQVKEYAILQAEKFEAERILKDAIESV